MTRPREPHHAIDPIFLERWSRRAFSGEPVSHDVLLTLFEAARWAPSARNAQPWHFLYATRDSADWPVFLDLVLERNRIWAAQAAVLVAIVSQSVRVEDGVAVPWKSHAFDAGAAWCNMALQASRIGVNVRAMGGFDRDRAPGVLGLSEGHEMQVMVAIGRPGEADILPDHLRSLEQPTDRRPLSDFVTQGRYPA